PVWARLCKPVSWTEPTLVLNPAVQPLVKPYQRGPSALREPGVRLAIGEVTQYLSRLSRSNLLQHCHHAKPAQHRRIGRRMVQLAQHVLQSPPRLGIRIVSKRGHQGGP